MTARTDADTPDRQAVELTPQQSRAQSWRIAAGRETIEAFVVAFILALLFRAFLAEAFVIPTGSMAPTLMGAHKDVFCNACGYNFRVGASRENAPLKEGITVVGGVCPNCRRVNALDLAEDANHATFNGDRILVNKFSYVLSEPKRWDVIVFKYPGNPKQNYIKRLVGLPDETLTLRHGDVYVRPTGTDQRSQILRKPGSTLLAMSQMVHDTNFVPKALVDQGFPSRWQPWEIDADQPPENSWQVSRQDGQFTATTSEFELGDANATQWLRYFHNLPTDDQWDVALSSEETASNLLSTVDPYRSAAITDFYAYDSYIFVSSKSVYAYKPFGLRQKLLGETSGVVFNPNYQSGTSVDQFDPPAIWGGQDSDRERIGRDGVHWVGDLILQADIEPESDATEIVLELVEAGIQFRCTIDLASGQATLSMLGEDGLHFDPSGDDPSGGDPSGGDPSGDDSSGDSVVTTPQAITPVRSGQSHTLQFSNCDDELLLMIDDQWITFDSPTTFDSRTFRTSAQNYPRFTSEHPLDAAPAAVGVTGGQATIESLRLHRDKYYIATKQGNAGGICDYDLRDYRDLTGTRGGFRQIQDAMASPKQWDTAKHWQTRREVTFELQQDQFFPMGDNSPESLDARCWAGVKERIRMPGDVNRDAWRWSDKSYVPRDLLVGRAVVVFWPHSWNEPVPFIPNFKRMKLIR